MSYKVYTTEAIVCGSRNSYTSDKSFLLFTRNTGMLWATARSVRMEKSKQRMALQDFSIIRVSLVRGKGGWRIGSVESTGNAYSQANTRRKRGNVTRIVRLLRQFIHGEDPHSAIFNDVIYAFSHVVSTSENERDTLVDVFTLRLLHALGYIAKKESFVDFLEDKDWVSITRELPHEAEKAITQALHVSHL